MDSEPETRTDIEHDNLFFVTFEDLKDMDDDDGISDGTSFTPVYIELEDNRCTETQKTETSKMTCQSDSSDRQNEDQTSQQLDEDAADSEEDGDDDVQAFNPGLVKSVNII